MKVPGETAGKGPHPTLWRTCRALANRRRIEMVQRLWRRPGQSVKELAEEVELSAGATSQYLRLLNSRGLLRVQRSGRWVRYRVAPDPSVVAAARIIEALTTVFERGGEPVETVFRAVTGFTHHRRVEIVRALGAAPMGFEELRQSTGIPRISLKRHLDKLTGRATVVAELVGPAERYRLAPTSGPLGDTLVALACSD